MLTYEEYFQLDPTKDAHLMPAQKMSGSSKGDTTYEQFLGTHQQSNMFYNDLLEMEYKFWETEEDKELRIKKLWIDLKRKNALAHDSPAKRSDDYMDLNTQIVELIRRLRWRVDQEMTRRSIEPLFKENYYTYDKDEFLIDADFEFSKIRNLLNKSPKLLREDPIMQIDYLKIIDLIKQKKLVENTSDQYDPSSAHVAHYYDLEKARKVKEREEQLQLEHFAKNFQEKEAQSRGQQVSDEYDTQLEAQIKQDKKSAAKEQLKLMKQFDNLAESLQKAPIQKIKDEENEVIETAGQIRKREREKNKKEKTLASKLRMKAKKQK